jgi:peptide/nickel transport system permease protein
MEVSIPTSQLTTRLSTIWRFARRNRVGSITVIFLVVIIAVSWIGPVLGTGDPEAIDPAYTLAPPSLQYPLGTEHLGRSVLARLVFALRVSLALATISALLAAAIGTLIGLIVGYVGGVMDELVMRFMDMIFAFPLLLMAILMAAILGAGIKGVLVAIVVVTVPTFSRIVRGPVLSVRERDYVTAAWLLGASSRRILFIHILPNVLAPLLVQISYTLSVALIIEGSLSFLGLGVQPPTPSVGSILRDGKVYMEAAPWMVFFPGITLAMIIIAINVFGDWLRDFLDPKLRRQALA